MILEKQQFVQCFHLSIDDLEGMIKEAVQSAIPSAPKNDNSVVKNEPESDLITPKEVCEIINVSLSTLWRYNTVTGVLKPKVKIGRKVYYSRNAVSNFLSKNTI